MIELDIAREVRLHRRQLAVVVGVEEGAVRCGNLSEKGIVGGSSWLRLSEGGGGKESERSESDKPRMDWFHVVFAEVERISAEVTAEWTRRFRLGVGIRGNETFVVRRR